MPSDTDYQRDILIVLQRIAGALECLCEHFGAMPRNNNKARKGGGK